MASIICLPLTTFVLIGWRYNNSTLTDIKKKKIVTAHGDNLLCFFFKHSFFERYKNILLNKELSSGYGFEDGVARVAQF